MNRRKYIPHHDSDEDCRRKARAILTGARKLLCRSEAEELQGIIDGKGPTLRVENGVTVDGKDKKTHDRPFERLCTEFAHLLK